MKLLDFMLRGLTRDGRAAHERPTLRFELSGVSAHAIKRITITAPNGLLFNRNPRALARELVLVREDGRAAVHTALATSTTLRITLGRAVERISLVLRRGALRLPPHPGFGLYDAHGFPTFLTVSGARGRTIHLMG